MTNEGPGAKGRLELVKTNLFSRFRNLFRKADTDYDYEDDYQDSYEEEYCETPDVAAETAEQEQPAAEEPAESVEEPSTMQSGRSLRMPHGAGMREPKPVASGVHVPLAPIIASMPLELQSRVIHDVGDLSIFLPIAKILPQLATGAVSLSFGELRKAAPRVFNTDRDQDAVPVAVPLSAVLPQISPEMLSRKHGPLQVDVP